MKRLRCPLCFFAAALLFFPCAIGWGEEGCSNRELTARETPVWRQTYQDALGRSVQVDCEILLPNVNAVPVLTAQAAAPVGEPRRSQLAAYFTPPAGTDLDYSFRSTDYSFALSFANPGVWKEGRGETPGRVGQSTHSLLQFDWNRAYADQNPLTVAQAADTVREKVRLLYPEADVQVMEIGLFDRLRVKKTGEYLREKGNYLILCRQSIGDVSILANIEEAYRHLPNDMPMASVHNSNLGVVRAEIYDENAYSQWQAAGNHGGAQAGYAYPAL